LNRNPFWCDTLGQLLHLPNIALIPNSSLTIPNLLIHPGTQVAASRCINLRLIDAPKELIDAPKEEGE
jgi:hypothetical protein